LPTDTLERPQNVGEEASLPGVRFDLALDPIVGREYHRRRTCAAPGVLASS